MLWDVYCGSVGHCRAGVGGGCLWVVEGYLSGVTGSPWGSVGGALGLTFVGGLRLILGRGPGPLQSLQPY